MNALDLFDVHRDPFAPKALHPAIDPDARSWALTIPGEPVAKGRARTVRIKTKSGKDFVSTYTPKKTVAYEDTIRYFAQREWNRELLAGVPIFARIIAYRSIPTSLSKGKREDAIAGRMRPIVKPDWDNYGKTVSDAFQDIVYANDSAIVDAWVSKYYALVPRMEIKLSW